MKNQLSSNSQEKDKIKEAKELLDNLLRKRLDHKLERMERKSSEEFSALRTIGKVSQKIILFLEEYSHKMRKEKIYYTRNRYIDENKNNINKEIDNNNTINTTKKEDNNTKDNNDNVPNNINENENLDEKKSQNLENSGKKPKKTREAGKSSSPKSIKNDALEEIIKTSRKSLKSMTRKESKSIGFYKGIKTSPGEGVNDTSSNLSKSKIKSKSRKDSKESNAPSNSHHKNVLSSSNSNKIVNNESSKITHTIDDSKRAITPGNRLKKLKTTTKLPSIKKGGLDDLSKMSKSPGNKRKSVGKLSKTLTNFAKKKEKEKSKDKGNKSKEKEKGKEKEKPKEKAKEEKEEKEEKTNIKENEDSQKPSNSNGLSLEVSNVKYNKQFDELKLDKTPKKEIRENKISIKAQKESKETKIPQGNLKISLGESLVKDFAVDELLIESNRFTQKESEDKINFEIKENNETNNKKSGDDVSKNDTKKEDACKKDNKVNFSNQDKDTKINISIIQKSLSMDSNKAANNDKKEIKDEVIIRDSTNNVDYLVNNDEVNFTLLDRNEKPEEVDINETIDLNISGLSDQFSLAEQFEAHLDNISRYLDKKDICNVLLVNKECFKIIMNILISKTEITIDLYEEEIAKIKETNKKIDFDNIKIKPFNFGTTSSRAISLLNTLSINNFIKIKNTCLNNTKILLIFDIYFIAAGKHKDLVKLNNNGNKWDFIFNYFSQEISNGSLGSSIESEINGKIFDDSTINLLYRYAHRYLNIISPSYYQKINKDIAIFVFLIKDILLHIGVMTGEKPDKEKEYILCNAGLQINKLILDELYRINNNIY